MMKACEVTGKTVKPLLLANIHTLMPLNVTCKFDKGCRTLSWANPVAFAQTFGKLGSPHDQSALLRTWTKGELRDNVTFILVPSNKTLSFVIGKAEAQQDASERRDGGGIQLRLSHIPEGSIAMTTSILTPEDQALLDDQGVKDEDIRINLLAALERCIVALEELDSQHTSDTGEKKSEHVDKDSGVDLVEYARAALERFKRNEQAYLTIQDGKTEFNWVKWTLDRVGTSNASVVQLTPARITQVKKVLSFMTERAGSKIQRAWRKYRVQEQLAHMGEEEKQTLTRSLGRVKKGVEEVQKAAAMVEAEL